MSASDERLALSVEEAAGLLGISTWLAYELVHQGQLPSLRLGRRIVIPRPGLERLVGLEPDQKPPDAGDGCK